MADRQKLELERDSQLQRKNREIEHLQSKLKVRKYFWLTFNNLFVPHGTH